MSETIFDQNGVVISTYAGLFAARVRAAREELGMSQAQLAERLADYGITLDATGITRLEKGRRMIRLNEATALMDVLGLSS